MGKCILKLDGKYIQWSSVSDSPCCPLLPEPLFRRYWEAEYGLSGGFDYLVAMRDLERNNGCSARGYTINEVLKNNRAGARERKMTKDQIIKAFTITDEKDFEGWLASRKVAVAADNAKWAEELKIPT